jgi:hypothetical protein
MSIQLCDVVWHVFFKIHGGMLPHNFLLGSTYLPNSSLEYAAAAGFFLMTMPTAEGVRELCSILFLNYIKAAAFKNQPLLRDLMTKTASAGVGGIDGHGSLK